MKSLFERNVYIRLAADGTHFISTTAYGRFFTRTAEVDVTTGMSSDVSAGARAGLNAEDERESMDENPLAPLKKRPSHWLSDGR
jgi:hypothetical protein